MRQTKNIGIIFLGILLLISGMLLVANASKLPEGFPETSTVRMLSVVFIALGLLVFALLLISEFSNRFRFDYSRKKEVAQAATETKAENAVETPEYFDGRDSSALVASVRSALSAASGRKEASNAFLKSISGFFEVVQAEVYLKGITSDKMLTLVASFAYYLPEEKTVEFPIGDGLIGQVADKGKLLKLGTVPQGYIKVASGLGSATPENLVIVPIMAEKIVVGVCEIASFKKFSTKDEELLGQISGMLYQKLSESNV